LRNRSRLPIRLTGKAALPLRCRHPERALRGMTVLWLNRPLHERYGCTEPWRGFASTTTGHWRLRRCPGGLRTK
jgi:hypothetical protein